MMRVFKIHDKKEKRYLVVQTPNGPRSTWEVSSVAKRIAMQKLGTGNYSIHTYKLELVHNED